MKNHIRLLLFSTLIMGLIFVSSCSDDDAPAPADPTVSFATSAIDANRGQQVTINGAVNAPGGFGSLEAGIAGVTITGPVAGSVDQQSFTATFTVPAEAEFNSTIAIEFTVIDELEQEGNGTFTITVVPEGAPMVEITGMTSGSAKRRESVDVLLNITAAEGISEVVVSDAEENEIETIAGADISDPSAFTFSFTIPDSADPEVDFILNFDVNDNAGQETATSAEFTIDVLPFDPVTISFTEFENETDTAFSEGSSQSISLTIGKDDLVSFADLNILQVVNDDFTALTDDPSEAESEFDYEFTVDQDFLDEVDLGFAITDEFGNSSDTISLSYDVLTTEGATFLIDEITVGTTTVQRVRGELNENTTFMSSNNYYLSGEVSVTEAVLTIQAGTMIFAETGEETQLVIDDEGVIMADATAANPIIMTSGAELEGGAAESGDWTGLRINGAEAFNSGLVNYVRVEYAGDGEAAFRLQNVDAATSISFVQVFNSVGIGIETRGGNVHMNNIVVTNAGEQSIELDDDDVGYDGSLQFVIIEQSADPEKDARDFEMRDDAEATVSNMTIVGPGTFPEITDPEERPDADAARIRNDAGGFNIYNMLIAEFPDDGFRQDDTDGITDINGDFVVAHSFIFQIGDQPTRDDFDNPETGMNDPLPFETNAVAFFNTIDAENTPASAAGIGVGDFVPDSEIPSAFDPTTLGGPFTTGQFVGAIGTTDWTLGWVLNADGSLRGAL